MRWENDTLHSGHAVVKNGKIVAGPFLPYECYEKDKHDTATFQAYEAAKEQADLHCGIVVTVKHLERYGYQKENE